MLSIVTALVQTGFFGSLMKEQLSGKVSFKSRFILTIALTVLAIMLWLMKMILPEGMIAGNHGSSIIESTAENCFSHNSYLTEVKRINDHKEKIVYYRNRTDVFYSKEKILSYSSNDPSKSEKIEYFELKNDDIEGLIEKDIAIVYKTSDGKIEYCVFDEKQSKGYDKSIYERALRRI